MVLLYSITVFDALSMYTIWLIELRQLLTMGMRGS